MFKKIINKAKSSHKNLEPKPSTKFLNKTSSKIVLGVILASFLGVTFVQMNSGLEDGWVVRIGNKTIGYKTFQSALDLDKKIILANNKDKEVTSYLDSNDFKRDVLNRLVNRVMMENLSKDLGVQADKKLIFNMVAKDQNFKDENGKFNKSKFQNFLKNNGLDEARYVEEISNEVAANMILQTLSIIAPANKIFSIEVEKFKKETREIEFVKVEEHSLREQFKPSKEELKQFFNDNKSAYAVPEFREFSYLTFSKNELTKDISISEQEVLSEYEAHKNKFTLPETRTIYHILFEKEDQAKSFMSKLDEAKKAKTNIKEEFSRLAHSSLKKDLKSILISGVSKRDLPEQISGKVFETAVGEYTPAMSSQLGFHLVFIVNKEEPRPVEFNKVKDGIKKSLFEAKLDKIVQEKIAQIDDALLTAKSLSEVADKFKLKFNSEKIVIGVDGKDSNQNQPSQIHILENFAKNGFALKEGQISKIFYNKNFDGFYLMKLENTKAKHDQSFEVVESVVREDLIAKMKKNALIKLAGKISSEIRENPSSFGAIAQKYSLAVKKEAMPRFLMAKGQNNASIPVQNDLMKVVFKMKVDEISDQIDMGDSSFVIAKLIQINIPTLSESEIQKSIYLTSYAVREELMRQYNAYILSIIPIKVNEQIFSNSNQ